MFAEFEKRTHEMAEAGEPLTVKSFRSVYRELLDAYFGPDFVVDETLELECFRIPHFYRAFYVYKYATGLSAAVALSRRVLGRWKTRTEGLLDVSFGRLQQGSAGSVAGRGRGYGQPRTGRHHSGPFRQLTEELDQLL